MNETDHWRRLAECDALSGAPLGNALKQAADEIDRLRAGEDPTPPREGYVLTPSQFLFALHQMTGEERIERLARLREEADAGERCGGANHIPHIAELREKIVFWEKKIADLTQYQNAMNWETSCLSCSKLLTASINDEEKIERLTEEREALRDIIEAIRTDADAQRREPITTNDNWRLGVYAQASRTLSILRDGFENVSPHANCLRCDGYMIEPGTEQEGDWDDAAKMHHPVTGEPCTLCKGTGKRSTTCTCGPATPIEEGPSYPAEDCPAHGNPRVLGALRFTEGKAFNGE